MDVIVTEIIIGLQYLVVSSSCSCC